MDLFLLPPPRPVFTARRFLAVLLALALGCVGTMVFASYELLTHPISESRSAQDSMSDLIAAVKRKVPLVEQQLDRQRLTVVSRNLEMIAIAAEAWLAAHPRARVVTYADLYTWSEMPLVLMPVVNEPYAGIIVRRDWSEIAINLPDGRRVAFPKPPAWRHGRS